MTFQTLSPCLIITTVWLTCRTFALKNFFMNETRDLNNIILRRNSLVLYKCYFSLKAPAQRMSLSFYGWCYRVCKLIFCTMDALRLWFANEFINLSRCVVTPSRWWHLYKLSAWIFLHQFLQYIVNEMVTSKNIVTSFISSLWYNKIIIIS